MHGLTANHLLHFLLQVLVLLGSAKLLGALFSKIRLPAVTAEICAGLLWGPSVLGHLWPQAELALFPVEPIQLAMLETTGWLGILLLLLVMGLEINVAALWKQRRQAGKVGLFSLLLPLVLVSGIILWCCPWLPVRQDLPGSLLLSLLLVVPSLPIALSAMREIQLIKTDLGLLATSALSISDLAGWAGFTILLTMIQHGSLDLQFVVQVLGFTIGFAVITLAGGRGLMDWVFRIVHKHSGNQAGVNETILVLTGMALGSITLAIGIQPFFGFFVAGLVCGESRFLNQQARDSVNQTVEAVFVPLFFASIGTRVDLVADFNPGLVAALAGLSLALRFLGAWSGGLVAGLEKKPSAVLALLHLPGGEATVVVGLLALESGILGPDLFVALLVAALLPTLFMGPLLHLLVRRQRAPAVWQHIAPVAIDLNGITPPLTSRETDASPAPALVLRSLCYAPPVRQFCDPETTITALMDREEAFSTALGRELAVPHVELKGLKTFAISLARCDAGIDWNAPDGKPVKLFVLILIPPGNTARHLAFLKTLAKAWSQPETRQACLACPLEELPGRLITAMEQLEPAR